MATEAVPAGHAQAVQRMSPPGEKKPAEHGLQPEVGSPRPIALEHVPGSQVVGLQPVALPVPNLPLGHALHPL